MTRARVQARRLGGGVSGEMLDRTVACGVQTLFVARGGGAARDAGGDVDAGGGAARDPGGDLYALEPPPLEAPLLPPLPRASPAAIGAARTFGAIPS